MRKCDGERNLEGKGCNLRFGKTGNGKEKKVITMPLSQTWMLPFDMNRERRSFPMNEEEGFSILTLHFYF